MRKNGLYKVFLLPLLLFVMAADSAPTLNWTITNRAPNAIRLKFFRDGGGWVWPGDGPGDAYALNPGGTISVKLTCHSAGENVCVGAEDAAGNKWGTTFSGNQACKDCCAHCGDNVQVSYTPVLVSNNSLPQPSTSPLPPAEENPLALQRKKERDIQRCKDRAEEKANECWASCQAETAERKRTQTYSHDAMLACNGNCLNKVNARQMLCELEPDN